MIRNVFDRPMFRVPGMGGNQPSGIMASSPNLIRVGTANANPLLTGSGSNAFQIPVYKDQTPPLSELLGNPTTFKNVIDPNQKINSGDIEGTAVAEDIKNQKKNLIYKKLKEIALRSKIAKGEKTVDSLDPKVGEKSQVTTSSIDDADEDYFGGDVPLSGAPLTNEGSGKADLKPNPNRLEQHPNQIF